MMSKRKYGFIHKLTYLSIWVMAVLPSIYFLNLQRLENSMVDEFILANGLQSADLNKFDAFKVSDAVRSSFEVDEDKFKVMKMNNRPFLRESTLTLLGIKEGLCGEGARVITNILLRLGYNASRITLFNKHLESTHTLVSIQTGGKDILIDSINSQAEVNDFLRNEDISIKDFHILSYTDSFKGRKSFKDARKKAELEIMMRKGMWATFFQKYRLYSYESIPFSKLLTKIGVDSRVLNLQRPARSLSSLAEKPYLQLFILCIFIGFMLICTTYLIGRRFNERM